MDNSPENIVWALEVLSALSDLRGYPQLENQQKSLARGFLSIVGPYEPIPYEIDPGGDHVPGGPKKFFTPKHYTAQQTVDWLMDELRRTCRVFPTIPEMEEVYMRGMGECWGDEEEKKRRPR